MKKKQMSTLGFIMEQMKIPTIALSRHLHVDPSLISKWRSGQRNLSSSSPYFNEIILFLMGESCRSEHMELCRFLSQLFPMDGDSLRERPEFFLRQLLSDPTFPGIDREKSAAAQSGHRAEVHIYEQNSGRRQAIGRLVDYCSSMPSPGHVLFMDSEEYVWLMEDRSFAERFSANMNSLLSRGFTADFVIHFSSYRERFVPFFEVFGLLLFHRDVRWHYYECYDENILNFSLFIADKALSLLGLSSGSRQSSTMVFTDSSLILQQEALAQSILSQCQKVFVDFEPDQCEDVVNYIRVIRKRGAVYAYLPAPAFISADEKLLAEILENNQAGPEHIRRCLSVNRAMNDIISSQYRGLEDRPEQIIQIFQLEEMERRAASFPFISCSLSLMCGRPIQVTRSQYARRLRELARSLELHPNMEAALLSQRDNAALPQVHEMNCWCKKNTWMVQMDRQGFRISDESTIVNAASITLERCMRRIPPERKNKQDVLEFLLRLAGELEY